jgi:hypothetical protein
MIARMKRDTGRPPALDVEHATFIQGSVSVIVASRNAQLVADVVRGCGCRVSRDRRQVTVLVEPSRAGTLLEDIAVNGRIAAVFSQPSTHRTIQLKGSDACVVRVTPTDRAVAARHLASWKHELGSIGYTPELAAAVRGAAEHVAAIRFTPSAAFQQTPGPGAGQRLAT